MCDYVLVLFGGVVTSTDDGFVVSDDCADRNLTVSRGPGGFFERLAHEVGEEFWRWGYGHMDGKDRGASAPLAVCVVIQA